MTVHRHLGSALPALLLTAALGLSLTACGDETATDESGSTSSDTPSATPSVTMSSPTGGMTDEQPGDSEPGAVDFDLVDTITVTAAGGALSPVAVPLGDAESVQGFLSQFESDDMTQQVQAAVDAAEVPDGQALYGAVVSIGCDSPTGVSVTESSEGLVITADPVKTTTPECFAAMTTVALVLAAS